MRRLLGPLHLPASLPRLLQQRRPGRIRGITRRLDRLLVASRHIHGEEPWSGIPAGVAKEHDHTAVRTPGWPLIVIALGEDALPGTVGAHDANSKPAFRLLGESNVVAPRRPDGGRIDAIPKA